MKRLGVCGGIGSGKSFVCSLMARMSVPVYDCDSRAKALYDTDEELRHQMMQHFGADLYDSPRGVLNRAMLSKIIFENPEELKWINALVHPLVRADIDRWFSERREEGYVLSVVESAVLLSSEELLARVDYTLAVLAPRALRLERCLRRSAESSRLDIEQRMAVQMSDADFERLADFTLINDGQKHILPQLDAILKQISDLGRATL